MYNSNYDLSLIIIAFLTTIGVLIVLILLLREVVCWYYKINKIIELQNNMINYLIEVSNNSKSINSKLGIIINEQLKNNVVKEKIVSETKIENKSNNTNVYHEIEPLTDEKAKKLLENIGYVLIKSDDKWIIKKNDNSGITRNVYTRDDLYKEIRTLFKDEKSKKNST